jgi:alkylation response protein AidB-like acyl-CoA dehydrogenase
MTTKPVDDLLRGGEWLTRSVDPGSVFTPERLTEEHRLIARTVTDFVDAEVLPVLDRLEEKDWNLARQLVRRCGDLGLLGVDVSEADGGVALDKVTSMLVSERMARSASFGAAFGAQSNLTILPLTLFGTADQKARYLPRLVSGELVGGYCLSEPGSGSDALGAKTRADRRDDGSFVLNGEKMWITNGGFADVFIVFAKVDGQHFTAFIVERAFGGVTSGKEEHKMGLHGSSTTAVLLSDVKVPAGNVLGEIGKGHKIAFNVLNFARFKLGAMCVGGARGAIGESARYAASRRQFGQPIASFGAIKHKLGEMTARAYAVESLVYRTIGMIDERLGADPRGPGGAGALAAFEEYAVEASIAKVAGSEMVDFVFDENIQIHGGNGFVRDYPAERHYRDSRVNRIFEGTNEINRLLIPGLLARRAAADPAVLAAARALPQELPDAAADPSDPLAGARRAVAGTRGAALLVFGIAVQTFGEKLGDQQEVLMHAADMLSDTFAADSAVLRASAAGQRQLPGAALHADACAIVADQAAARAWMSGRQALAAMLEGDTLTAALERLRRFTSTVPVNTVALRRRLADAAVAKGGWVF